jgi:hypothetical protein
VAKKTSQKPPKKPTKPAARPESVAMRTVAVPSSLGEGEVRLYDAWKASLPDLVEPPPEALLAEFQWVLVHFPSRRGVVVKGDRLEGLRLLKQIEKGENVLGLLPETLKPSHARTGARARARGQKDEETGGVGEGEKAKKEVKRAKLRIKIEKGLDFDRTMKAAFPNEFIAAEVARLLRAQKAVFDKEGNLVDYVDDYMTQTNAVKLMIEHAQGRAGEKPPPPAEKKRVTYEQLVGQIQTSPAARLMLRRLIDEADEAAKAKPEATAETPAAGA